MVSTYVLLLAFVYIPGISVIGTCTFVHGSLPYMHICVTTAVSVYMRALRGDETFFGVTITFNGTGSIARGW